jgi:hypothetical protein
MKSIIETEYDCKAAVYSFADSLRYFCGDLFGEQFTADSKDRTTKGQPIRDLETPLFVEPIDSPTSPRQVLIKIGESMRHRFGRDIFCEALGHRIEESDANYVIIDDLRKENELNWLRYRYKNLVVVGLAREEVPSSYDPDGRIDFLDFPLVDNIETLVYCDQPLENVHNYETINSILRTYNG